MGYEIDPVAWAQNEADQRARAIALRALEEVPKELRDLAWSAAYKKLNWELDCLQEEADAMLRGELESWSGTDDLTNTDSLQKD